MSLTRMSYTFSEHYSIKKSWWPCNVTHPVSKYGDTLHIILPYIECIYSLVNMTYYVMSTKQYYYLYVHVVHVHISIVLCLTWYTVHSTQDSVLEKCLSASVQHWYSCTPQTYNIIVCVLACVLACVRACVRVCVRACVHACVHACVCVCMCTCTCMCMCRCIYK